MTSIQVVLIILYVVVKILLQYLISANLDVTLINHLVFLTNPVVYGFFAQSVGRVTRHAHLITRRVAASAPLDIAWMVIAFWETWTLEPSMQSTE